MKKHSDMGMIPMECLYLNKNALNTIVGQQQQPIKHFALKRKPKSAALRAELLQKCMYHPAKIIYLVNMVHTVILIFETDFSKLI